MELNLANSPRSSKLPPSNGEGDEGGEGHEEEDREQDCNGPVSQGDGAPRVQGEDRWRLDGEGPDQEQDGQGCEQEAQRLCQEEPVDHCMQEGARSPEDQRLLPAQEGLTVLPEGEGVL